MNKTNMTSRDFAKLNYDKIAERYFAIQSEKNRKALQFCSPRNIEGRRYNGANELHLILFSCAFDAKPIFATFNMLKRHGLNVKRGSKAVEIGLYQQAIKKNDAEKKSSSNALATKKELAESEEIEHYAFFKRYFVFNVGQCEGVSDVDYDQYACIKQTPFKFSPVDLAAALLKSPEKFGLDCAQGIIRACLLADVAQMFYQTECGAQTSTYLLEIFAKIAKNSKLTFSIFKLLAETKKAFGTGGMFASIIKDARKIADTIISKKMYQLSDKAENGALLKNDKTADLF